MVQIYLNYRFLLSNGCVLRSVSRPKLYMCEVYN
jgi:hypothetical protein